MSERDRAYVNGKIDCEKDDKCDSTNFLRTCPECSDHQSGHKVPYENCHCPHCRMYVLKRIPYSL